jgi:hypothetical protein
MMKMSRAVADRHVTAKKSYLVLSYKIAKSPGRKFDPASFQGRASFGRGARSGNSASRYQAGEHHAA